MIKTPSFTSRNSLCYSFYGEEAIDNISIYVDEALFVLQREKVIPCSIFCYCLVEIETSPWECQTKLPELTALLKNRGIHLLHQNAWGLQNKQKNKFRKSSENLRRGLKYFLLQRPILARLTNTITYLEFRGMTLQIIEVQAFRRWCL